MRILRPLAGLSVAGLTLAGLNVVGLAGITGRVVSAQSDDSPPAVAVEVRGTSTLVEEQEPGTVTLEDGVFRSRGAVLITAEDASDPRVIGRGTITLNVDAYADEGGALGARQIRFGTMRLENEDGAWEGRFAGRLSNGRFIQTYWLVGEGAYNGLTYVVTAGGDGPVWASEGLIYPGDPPTSATRGAVEGDLPGEPAPVAYR